MDPFRIDFDPLKALNWCIPYEPVPYACADDFEKDLVQNDIELVKRLLALDLVEQKKRDAEARVGKNPSKKVRTRTLEAIMKDGRRPTVGLERPKPPKDPRNTYIRHVGGPYDRMAHWLRTKARVYVKLRSDARIQEGPNRVLQGVLVAFDKHWNLIMRDIDEVYAPARRLGYCQTSANATPAVAKYIRDDSNSRLLRRHLKCSMITGTSVVAIYNPDG